MKKAFTMIELVFVIVVIGILSAIAVPKFAATRDDAHIAKTIATVSTVRSAISTTRQKNILRGVFTDLDATTIGNNFWRLLDYNVTSCSTSGCNGWSTGGTTAVPVFTFYGPTGNLVMTYSNKRLNCTSGCADYGL